MINTVNAEIFICCKRYDESVIILFLKHKRCDFYNHCILQFVTFRFQLLLLLLVISTAIIVQLAIFLYYCVLYVLVVEITDLPSLL